MDDGKKELWSSPSSFKVTLHEHCEGFVHKHRASFAEQSRKVKRIDQSPVFSCTFVTPRSDSFENHVAQKASQEAVVSGIQGNHLLMFTSCLRCARQSKFKEKPGSCSQSRRT